jgi:hypothetical protein
MKYVDYCCVLSWLASFILRESLERNVLKLTIDRVRIKSIYHRLTEYCILKDDMI